MKFFQNGNFIKIILPLYLMVAFVNVNSQGTDQWEILNEGISAQMMDFVNEEVGWMLGGGILFKTEDAGVTWDFISNMENMEVHSLDFMNESTGWAVYGYYSKTEGNYKYVIKKSMDGGQSWEDQYEWIERKLNDLFVVNDTVVS